MSLLQTIYLIHTRPLYDQTVLGRLEIFNSMFLLVTSYFLIMFTDFVIDPIIRSQIGEFYFWLSIGIIVINVLITIIVLLRNPYLYIKARFLRWKERKARILMIKQRIEEEKKMIEDQEQRNELAITNGEITEKKSQFTRSLKKLRVTDENIETSIKLKQ